MSRFDSLGSTYMAPSLLYLHGETVTYKPAGGDTREIQAIVDRDTPETPSPAGVRGRPKASIRVMVVNSSTEGITPSELNIGGDKIELPLRIGESATDRNIRSLSSQDGGMLELEVT